MKSSRFHCFRQGTRSSYQRRPETITAEETTITAMERLHAVRVGQITHGQPARISSRTQRMNAEARMMRVEMKSLAGR
jgi:hypothetical protein